MTRLFARCGRARGKACVSTPGVGRVRTAGLFEHPAGHSDALRDGLSWCISNALLLCLKTLLGWESSVSCR
jgi:hypothetical protein